MNGRITATGAKFIGILSVFSGRNMAAARSTFDSKLFRKDGKFVQKELQSLNPESLNA